MNYIILWKRYPIKYDPLMTSGFKFLIRSDVEKYSTNLETAHKNLDYIYAINNKNPNMFNDFSIAPISLFDMKIEKQPQKDLKEIAENIRSILLTLTDGEREIVMTRFMDIDGEGFCNYCWKKLSQRETCWCMHDD